MTEGNLLQDISGYIGRYVATSDENKLILSVFSVHAWSFHHGIPKTTAYAYINSAEKRSGKTLTLDVLATLVPNPLKAVSMTPATLFRSIDQLGQPCMMIDEVDTVWSKGRSGNKELNAVINAGCKIGATVPRVDKGEVRQFNVFGSKVLSGINDATSELPDTVLDRCIPIVLRRKATGQGDTVPFFSTDVQSLTGPILDRVEAWLTEHAETLKAYPLEVLDGLNDRTSELVWPMVAIADTFGVREEFVSALRYVFADYASLHQDATTKLLQGIADTFSIEGIKIQTEDVLVMTGIPNAKELSAALEPLGLAPMNVRKGNTVRKGFTLAQFADTFDLHGVTVE